MKPADQRRKSSAPTPAGGAAAYPSFDVVDASMLRAGFLDPLRDPPLSALN